MKKPASALAAATAMATAIVSTWLGTEPARAASCTILPDRSVESGQVALTDPVTKMPVPQGGTLVASKAYNLSLVANFEPESSEVTGPSCVGLTTVEGVEWGGGTPGTIAADVYTAPAAGTKVAAITGKITSDTSAILAAPDTTTITRNVAGVAAAPPTPAPSSLLPAGVSASALTYSLTLLNPLREALTVFEESLAYPTGTSFLDPFATLLDVGAFTLAAGMSLPGSFSADFPNADDTELHFMAFGVTKSGACVATPLTTLDIHGENGGVTSAVTSFSACPVPEPSTGALVATGLAGVMLIGGAARRRLGPTT